MFLKNYQERRLSFQISFFFCLNDLYSVRRKNTIKLAIMQLCKCLMKLYCVLTFSFSSVLFNSIHVINFTVFSRCFSLLLINAFGKTVCLKVAIQKASYLNQTASDRALASRAKRPAARIIIISLYVLEKKIWWTSCFAMKCMHGINKI